MSRRRSALCLAVVGAAAVLAAGCGGGGGSSATTSTTSEGVPTDTWANGFCSAFSDWTNELKHVAQTFQSTPTKASLQSAADDIKSANATFANDLKGLGRPEIERGEEAKNTVNTLADQIKADSEKISNAVSNMSSVSDIAAAAGALTSALTVVQTQLNDAVTKLDAIAKDSKSSLKDAISNAPACKALSSSS